MDLLIHGKRPYKSLHSDQRDKTKRGLSSAVRGCTAALSVTHSSRNHFFRADISYISDILTFFGGLVECNTGASAGLCHISPGPHLSAPQQAEPKDDFCKQIGKNPA